MIYSIFLYDYSITQTTQKNYDIWFFLYTFLALSPGEVWTLDRGVFQQIMMQTGMKKIEEKLNFLKSVPIFSKMSNDILLRLSDALEVVSTISLEKKLFLFMLKFILTFFYIFCFNLKTVSQGKKIIVCFVWKKGWFCLHLTCFCDVFVWESLIKIWSVWDVF